MHMIVGRRCGRFFLVELRGLAQQQIGVGPATAFARDPARAHIALAVDEEFHMRGDRRIGLRAGLAQAAAEQGVSGEGFLAAVGQRIDFQRGEAALRLGVEQRDIGRNGEQRDAGGRQTVAQFRKLRQSRLRLRPGEEHEQHGALPAMLLQAFVLSARRAVDEVGRTSQGCSSSGAIARACSAADTSAGN